MARDILCASMFGTSMVWDAFTIAFKIPNLFRRLFGEGALSAAFIPVFTEYLEKHSKEEAWCLARTIATTLIITLTAIVIIGEISFYVIQNSFQLQPKWQMIFELLVILFPYVIFICLVAFSMAILNSLKHFLLPSLSPIVLNMCWISSLVIFAPLFGNNLQEKILCVAFAILIAGFIQIAIQVPLLKKFGLSFKPNFNFKHPAVKQIAKLIGPTIVGLAIVQINVLMDGLIAIGFAPPIEGDKTFTFLSREFYYPLKTGAASVLYYGDRIIQFPLGVFGIALASVIFPLFSKHAARKDWEMFKLTLNQASQMVLFIGIPASIGLILLRLPLVELFYERNEFNIESTRRTTSVIFFYSLAVWAYCGLHIIIRAFYSLKDTTTPMKVGLCMVGLNLVLNLILIWNFSVGGLALATSISAILQLVILLLILKRRLNITFSKEILVSFAKTATATLIMAVICVTTQKYTQLFIPDNDLVSKIFRLILPFLVSILTFILTAYIIKSEELKSLIKSRKN